MKTRLLVATLASISFGLVPLLRAADAPVETKPGYTVVTEISFDEQGTPTEAKVVKSDDPTGDHTLEQLALNLAQQDKQPPRLRDGKAVKFKARRPFNFPVEGDQGPAAQARQPVLRAGHQVIPKYPEALAEKGEIGGAIVELTIRADGTVKAVRTLRASHPEFAQAAEAALGQWVFNPDTTAGAPAESHWNAAIGFTTAGRNLELDWRLAPRPSLGGFIIGHLPPAAPAEKPVAPPAPGK